MRSHSRLAVAIFIIAVATAACSGSKPDTVVIEDGTLPPETATTTTAGPAATTDTTDTTALGPPTLDEASLVSTVGIDAIAFGMELAEAETAAGTRLVALDENHDPACYEVAPEAGPAGLTFLVRDGRVERLDITEAGLTTTSGAGVGTTADEINTLFTDRIQPADGPDGTPWLVFVPEDEGDAQYRVIFELADDQVVRYRSGRLPEVESGCT